MFKIDCSDFFSISHAKQEFIRDIFHMMHSFCGTVYSVKRNMCTKFLPIHLQIRWEHFGTEYTELLLRMLEFFSF